MSKSLYFYDLETSGFNPREQRIMQFAGQRTDLKLNPIGEPDNYLIKMTDDILPDPDAVLLTGITPQMTIADGITEAEFLKLFNNEISIQGTIFTGYNSIRFDDEFMRFLHYRNFYDAYEWHWSEDRSRWDLLDVVRMTRALRPNGIKWPFNSEGQPANQLGLLTGINNLSHSNAHDALSDVLATIDLARLLSTKQPKLFKYLLELRDKKEVKKIVNTGQPFVYTCGKFSSDFEKTTVVLKLVDSPNKNGAIVYDLRYDPSPYLDLSAEKLAEMWQHYCKDRPCSHPKLPVKTLQYNRCPAIAPLGVFNLDCQKRLQLSISTIEKNKTKFNEQNNFIANLIDAIGLVDKEYQAKIVTSEMDVDGRLYDGFIGDNDKSLMAKVHKSNLESQEISKFSFSDERLSQLLPLYKARNYPKLLNANENETWEKFRINRLLAGKQSSKTAKYFDRLSLLAENTKLSDKQRYLIDELQLYGQSIIPILD